MPCHTKTIARFAILIFAVAIASAVTAADNGSWKRSLSIDLTTTQTSYSDSWVGGEAGSVNWVSNLNGHAERQILPWFNLKTALKLSFGQTLTQNAETGSWSKPSKSTDLVDWENVGRLTVQALVDPYAAFRIETQFLDAFNPAKKLYFTPVRLTESAGIARKLYEKDKSFITSRLGLGLRQTLKKATDIDLKTLDSTFIDGGFESVTDVELIFNKKLRYTGKLTLYKAVYFSEKDAVRDTPSADYWKAVDINWENIISASLTDIVTVNFYSQLLFDKQVSKKGRVKQTLAIGLVFKMI